MRFLILMLLAFGVGCKDFVGNPHKKALPPRLVAVKKDSLQVEPASWYTGIKSNHVKILFQNPGLAEYEVHLVQTQGLKIRKVDKSERPDSIVITLEIKENAPAQKAEFVFSKGKKTITHEYPIRIRMGND